MDRTTYEKLLSKISENLQTGVPRGDNDTFNVFTVLGVETKEVIICRLLRELLDPKGSHQLGEKPLLFFAKSVLHYQDFSEIDAKNARVIAEEIIDGDRRVDLVIHTGRKVVPIEVKVWAGDQDAQLSDYYNYYQRKGLRSIFYLTPTGWSPSMKSRGNLKVGEEIQLLAFNEDIKPWLSGLKPYCEQEKVRFCVEQFEEVIDCMCARSTDLATIMELLKLDEPFRETETLKAAIKLLSYKDEIERKIIVNYLLEKLCVDTDKYELIPADKEDKKEINDNHALLKVVMKNSKRTVAWICVETNLYIVAKKVKTPDGEIWDPRSVPEKEYFWQYLSPDGVGIKFALKRLNYFPEKQIEFGECLKDIDLGDDA